MSIGWRINGQALTDALCTADGIQYMEVDVLAQQDYTGVGYTEVACALDRYPLFDVPLGAVQIQVRGLGVDTAQRPCVLWLGNATATTTAQLPDTPTIVDLAAVACP